MIIFIKRKERKKNSFFIYLFYFFWIFIARRKTSGEISRRKRRTTPDWRSEISPSTRRRRQSLTRNEARGKTTRIQSLETLERGIADRGNGLNNRRLSRSQSLCQLLLSQLSEEVATKLLHWETRNPRLQALDKEREILRLIFTTKSIFQRWARLSNKTVNRLALGEGGENLRFFDLIDLFFLFLDLRLFRLFVCFFYCWFDLGGERKVLSRKFVIAGEADRTAFRRRRRKRLNYRWVINMGRCRRTRAENAVLFWLK